MNTSIHNRNQAFSAIADRLPEKRQRVFKHILSQENVTAQELAQKTSLPINEITGRITELKNAHLIVETGSKRNRHSNKKNTAYRVVESIGERIDLINKTFAKLQKERKILESDLNAEISEYSVSLIYRELGKIRSKQNSLERILLQLKLQRK